MPIFQPSLPDYAMDIFHRAEMIMMNRSYNFQNQDHFTGTDFSTRHDSESGLTLVTSLTDCLPLAEKCMDYFDTLFDNKLEDALIISHLRKSSFG